MDSYSCTSIETVKFSHTWEIENFDIFKNCGKLNCLKSEEFAASKNSQEKFYLAIDTNSSTFRIIIRSNCIDINHFKYKHELSVSIENKYSRKSSPENWLAGNQSLDISFADFYKETNKILPDDTLKIRCEITMFRGPWCKSLHFSQVPECKIHNHLGALLNSEEFADVTIVTGDGKKIPAHKNILSARSKVFAAMFKHPLEESQQNCVKISEFKYEVVLEMLRFIYTESAPKLKDMTAELLSAADKYDLERLKAMCLICLRENLCVETAALTLKLADLYQEEGLKKYSLNYIKHHSEDVFETPMWKDLDNTEKNIVLQSICALKLDDK